MRCSYLRSQQQKHILILISVISPELGMVVSHTIKVRMMNPHGMKCSNWNIHSSPTYHFGEGMSMTYCVFGQIRRNTSRTSWKKCINSTHPSRSLLRLRALRSISLTFQSPSSPISKPSTYTVKAYGLYIYSESYFKLILAPRDCAKTKKRVASCSTNKHK